MPGPLAPDAFALFYMTYLLTVFRALERIGARKADVQDITQQVFLKIHKNFDKVPAERVHSWIEMICEQQAAEHYRLFRNRFETPQPNVGEGLPHSDDVHAQFERCEMEALVKEILDGMDAPLREVLVRREFHDESFESIASSLGIARNTVYARLAEAKRIFAVRSKRILGDDRRALMLLPLFGANTFRDADLQSLAFVDKMRARIWQGIADELGFDGNPFFSFTPTPRKTLLRRVLDNRGFLVTSGAAAGVFAALLWPRDALTIGQHAAAVSVHEHVALAAVANSESALASIPTTAQHVESPQRTQPAQPPATSTANRTVSPPNVQVDQETRTLEKARGLIDTGRYAEALAVLAQHQSEFPDSQFAPIRSRYIAVAQKTQR